MAHLFKPRKITARHKICQPFFGDFRRKIAASMSPGYYVPGRWKKGGSGAANRSRESEPKKNEFFIRYWVILYLSSAEPMNKRCEKAIQLC